MDEPDHWLSPLSRKRANVLELRVAEEDLGKVIGKQGRTVRSIRTVLSAAGTKARKRVVLEILE